MNGLRKQVVHGVKWSVILKITSIPIRVATSVILVRGLSRHEYGLLSTILNLGNMLVYVTSLGTQHGLSRFVPEFVQTGQLRNVNRLVAWCTLARAGATFGALALLALFWHRLSDFFNIPSLVGSALVLVFGILFLQRVTEVFGAQFHNAVLDLRAVTIHDTVRSILFGVGIFAYGWLHGRFTMLLVLLFAVELFSLAFFGGSTWRHIIRHNADDRGSGSHAFDWRRILNYCLFNMFYMLGGIAVGTGIDGFVVARYFGMADVALYTFALGQIATIHSFNPTILFKSIINNVFIRKFTETKDKGTLAYGFAFIWKLSIFFGFPALGAMCLLARPIITHVYKAEFLGAAPAIWIFSIMFLSRYVVFGLATVINALELVKYLLFINVVGVLNLVASILLAPIFGIYGVAAATCGAEILFCLFLYFVVRAKSGIEIRFLDRSITKVLANSAVAFFAMGALSKAIEGVFSLLGVLAIGATAYLGCSLVNRPFSQEERELINRVFGRRLWVF